MINWWSTPNRVQQRRLELEHVFEPALELCDGAIAHIELRSSCNVLPVCSGCRGYNRSCECHQEIYNLSFDVIVLI